MEPDPKSRALMRQYLLGELPEAERDRVEEELFTEEAFLDDLSLAEDDLIDSYVGEELTAAERASFEANFLSAPRRRERVAIARSLLARRPPVTILPIRSAVRRRPAAAWVWPLAAAAAIVVVSGAVVMRLNSVLDRQTSESARLTQQIEQLRAEVARKAAPPAPNKEELLAELRKGMEQPGSPALPPLGFVLTPADVRRNVGGSGQRLLIPAGRHAVQLRLTLSPHTKPYAAYRAAIQKIEGGEVWSGDRLQAAKGPAGLTLTLTVPSVALPPGDYRILITGLSTGGEVEEVEDYYVFQVGK